jgi:integrase/recombinase XerD
MADIQWERYPEVARIPFARTWLTIQHNVGLAPATIDAYGRALHEYLAFCTQQPIDPLLATREHAAAYVRTLLDRPHRSGQNSIQFESGVGLSNATIQQRLVAVRLFYD